jgi:hypothetical protein
MANFMGILVVLVPELSRRVQLSAYLVIQECGFDVPGSDRRWRAGVPF